MTINQFNEAIDKMGVDKDSTVKFVLDDEIDSVNFTMHQSLFDNEFTQEFHVSIPLKLK